MLAKLDKYGTVERVPGIWRPRTASTADNVATVEELVRSEEDKPQTHCAIREAAREIGMHHSSVRRIIMTIFECVFIVCRYSMIHSNVL